MVIFVRGALQPSPRPFDTYRWDQCRMPGGRGRRSHTNLSIGSRSGVTGTHAASSSPQPTCEVEIEEVKFSPLFLYSPVARVRSYRQANADESMLRQSHMRLMKPESLSTCLPYGHMYIICIHHVENMLPFSCARLNAVFHVLLNRERIEMKRSFLAFTSSSASRSSPALHEYQGWLSQLPEKASMSRDGSGCRL